MNPPASEAGSANISDSLGLKLALPGVTACRGVKTVGPECATSDGMKRGAGRCMLALLSLGRLVVSSCDDCCGGGDGGGEGETVEFRTSGVDMMPE